MAYALKLVCLLTLTLLCLLFSSMAMDDVTESNDVVISMLPDVRDFLNLSLNELYEELYDLNEDQISSLLKSKGMTEGLQQDIRFVIEAKHRYEIFLDKFAENIPKYAQKNRRESQEILNWLIDHVLPCLLEALQANPDKSKYTQAELLSFKAIADNLDDENIAIFFYATIDGFLEKLKAVPCGSRKPKFATIFFEPFFKWILSEFDNGHLLLFFASPKEVIKDLHGVISQSFSPNSLAIPPVKETSRISQFNRAAAPITKYGALAGISVMLIRLIFYVQHLEADIHSMNQTLYNFTNMYTNYSG